MVTLIGLPQVDPRVIAEAQARAERVLALQILEREAWHEVRQAEATMSHAIERLRKIRENIARELPGPGFGRKS